MDFPIVGRMAPDACYRFLLYLLHPGGLRCPRCRRDDRAGVQARHRAPVLDYRCCHCGRVFNAFTGTPLQATRRSPAQWSLILRGIAQGTPTARLARELGCDRMHPLELRHRLQGLAAEATGRVGRVPGTEVEADEMFQNAGEKGVPHPDPADPPRRRANKRRGHGNFANDRPPVVGVVSRQTGEAVLGVVERTDQPALTAFVTRATGDGATVYTDEWSGYARLPEVGRGHATVNHTPGKREWARDDDGDGVREVHDNTLEGRWAALRTFLRPFRGVSKHFLHLYVAVFQWVSNRKVAVPGVVRVLLGATGHHPDGIMSRRGCPSAARPC
jgi:transposase-like protein